MKGTSMTGTSMTATNSHIVAIRREGVIKGYQLRIDGGGAGRSKLFSASKYGSEGDARKAAQKAAKSLGLPKPKPRGGSAQGRVPHNSATQVAGIRFRWTQLKELQSLTVVASWVDRSGKNRQTAYAVASLGLEGALDSAIAARTSCGAPLPDRAALLKLLRREYRTKAH